MVAVVAVTSSATQFTAIQPEEQLRPWEEVRRALELRQRRTASWAPRLVMIGVVAIGVMTGLSLNPRVYVDLSWPAALPAPLGFVRSNPSPHPTVGYVAGLPDDERRRHVPGDLIAWCGRDVLVVRTDQPVKLRPVGRQDGNYIQQSAEQLPSNAKAVSRNGSVAV
jgi:hypothetical protein